MDLALATASAVPVRSTTLEQVPSGTRTRVVAVGGDTGLRRRLLEMGLCNRAEVEVVRRAPLGDPIELCLRGYHLSLRADQARLVVVEKL